MKQEVKKLLVKKLGEDKYHWAWEVQSKNFPFWTEAFDYAYNLGYSRAVKDLKKGK